MSFHKLSNPFATVKVQIDTKKSEKSKFFTRIKWEDLISNASYTELVTLIHLYFT